MARRNPLVLAALLRREPGLTQRQIVARLGWQQRIVSRMLRQLEVAAVGKQPCRYAIRLPSEKRRALQ